ncbi:MAG: ATP-binding protein, partial [Anaerolineae bacterium]|nr:ATP-binding protein [Anaerolineae bacterium]
MSLSSILRRGPGLQLEIMTTPSAERLAETMIAFANTDGGSILLGVDAQGQITGALAPEDAESLLRAALAQCRPLVITHWEQFEDRAGVAVAITVPRSTELHAL